MWYNGNINFAVRGYMKGGNKASNGSGITRSPSGKPDTAYKISQSATKVYYNT